MVIISLNHRIWYEYLVFLSKITYIFAHGRYKIAEKLYIDKTSWQYRSCVLKNYTGLYSDSEAKHLRLTLSCLTGSKVRNSFRDTTLTFHRSVLCGSSAGSCYFLTGLKPNGTWVLSSQNRFPAASDSAKFHLLCLHRQSCFVIPLILDGGDFAAAKYNRLGVDKAPCDIIFQGGNALST